MKPTFFVLPLLIFHFIYSNPCLAQANHASKKYINPFDTLKYDEVIAYDYNGSPQLQIVVNGEILSKKDRIFKQKKLSNRQVSKLNKTLGNTKSYGGETAACFDPHFGIVFFYQNKIVGHISICLACNYLYSTPKIPATDSHPTDICDGCYAYGFSKNARKRLSRIVRKLRFSHWQINNQLF